MDFIWISLLVLLCGQRSLCDHYPGHEEKDEQGSPPKDCAAEGCDSYVDTHPIDELQEEYLSPIEAEGKRRAKRTHYVFPQSRDLINTSFTCEGKPYIPGFYADVEANCQIFHVCYSELTEHFLCPPNTAFDQRNLVCNRLNNFRCHETVMHYESNRYVSIADKKREPKFSRRILDEEYPPESSTPAYVTDGESAENSFLKIYLLAKLLEASDIIKLMERFPEPPSRYGRSAQESTTPDVIEDLLAKAFEVIFPLLPVRFNVTSPEPKPSRSFSWPVITVRDTTTHVSRKERVLEILSLIFKTIEQTAGIISGLTRTSLVTNYLNFLLNDVKSH